MVRYWWDWIDLRPSTPERQDMDENTPTIGDDEQAEIDRVTKTHVGDGPGDDDPGEGDFVSYEDPDVMEEGL